MTTLDGRQALVCGSTQGIGRACADALARAGARVVLLARDEVALERVCAELPGADHGWLAADFDLPQQVERAIAGGLEQRGAMQILVNNSGGPPGGPVHRAAPEEFRAGIERHLVCSQLLLQALLPGMREAGWGRVINIISTSVKQPIAGLGVSNTVRAAMASWAKTLAGELGPQGITVNNVLPGATRTARLEALVAARAGREAREVAEVEEEMKRAIPARRFGRPEEIAAAVAFLASPAADYVNGINLPVDGGRTACL